MKTSIKQLLSILVLLISCYSANGSIKIIGMPENSYGYLIWETDYSNSHYSLVEIFETDLTTANSSPVSIDKTQVWDGNYLKISKDIWQSSNPNVQYNISVSTFTLDNNLIDIVQGLPGGPGILVDSWKCQGPNYAYQIDNRDLGFNNGHSYSVQPTYNVINDQGVQVPYYRYFDHDEFAEYTGLLIPSYGNTNPNPIGIPFFHGLSEWDSDDMTNTDELAIMRLDNSPTVNYKDINGNVITGNYVYALKKTRGNWVSGFTGGEMVTLTNQSANYTNPDKDLNFMINFLNTNVNPSTPLACAGNVGGAFDITSGGGINDTLCADECNYGIMLQSVSTLNHIRTEEDESGNIHVYLESVDDFYNFIDYNWCCDDPNCGPECGASSGTEGNSNLHFYEEIEFLSVSSFNNGNTSILNTTGSQLVALDGTPNLPSLNLGKGLHRIVVKYPGRSVDYVYFEVVSAGIASAPLKDFFSSSAFPNPTTGFNNYNIQMETSAPLNVTYEVFDSQGNRLNSTFLVLKDDHNEVHRFNLPSSYPSGIIIHKFTFEDGSYETVSTIN